MDSSLSRQRGQDDADEHVVPGVGTDGDAEAAEDVQRGEEEPGDEAERKDCRHHRPFTIRAGMMGGRECHRGE